MGSGSLGPWRRKLYGATRRPGLVVMEALRSGGEDTLGHGGSKPDRVGAQRHTAVASFHREASPFGVKQPPL